MALWERWSRKQGTVQRIHWNRSLKQARPRPGCIITRPFIGLPPGGVRSWSHPEQASKNHESVITRHLSMPPQDYEQTRGNKAQAQTRKENLCTVPSTTSHAGEHAGPDLASGATHGHGGSLRGEVNDPHTRTQIYNTYNATQKQCIHVQAGIWH